MATFIKTIQTDGHMKKYLNESSRRQSAVFSFFLCILLVVSACKNKESYKKEIELKGMTYSQISFIEQIRKGNKDNVALFIEAGIDINASDEDSTSALMVAVVNDYLEIIQLLIKNGANVNWKNNNGETALHIAAVRGHDGIIKLLLEKGAKINEKSNDGLAALHIAAARGQDGIIKLLLEKGANIKSRAIVKSKEGWVNHVTALQAAEATGHYYIVHLLQDAQEKALFKRKQEISLFKNSTYHFRTEHDIETIKLKNGVAAYPDKLKYYLDEENLAFGDINKDGLEDAIVFIYKWSSGSRIPDAGAMLIMIKDKNGNFDNTYSMPWEAWEGDGRDFIISIDIQDNDIIITRAVYAATDAMYRPSLVKTYKYSIPELLKKSSV